MAIKLGNLDISSFKVGTGDCSVYLGTVKLYPSDTPPTPTPIPTSGCDIIVDSITAYTGSSFSSAFNLEDMKWYELNNNSQYEEYGIMGSGRNITTYEGKLTVDGDYEYQYSGNSWVNVGQVTASTGSNVALSKYIDSNTTSDMMNMTISTTFSILVSDVQTVAQEQGGTFSFSIDGNYGEHSLSVNIDEANQMFDYFINNNYSYDSTYGTITSDGYYYYFSMSDIDEIRIDNFNFYADNDAGFTMNLELTQFEIWGDGYGNQTYTYSGCTMPTTFSIPMVDVDAFVQQYGSFSMTIYSEDGMDSLQISENSYSDSQGNYGSVSDDGTNYIYTMSYPSNFTVSGIELYGNSTAHMLFGGGGTQVPVQYTTKDPIYAKEFSSTTAMEDARCPDILVGEYAIVGNDAYRLGEDGIWHQVQPKLIAIGESSDFTFVIPCGVGNRNLMFTDYQKYPYSHVYSATVGNCCQSVSLQAFKDCTSLVEVNLGNSISGITLYAFYGCTSLTSIGAIGSGASVEIPSSVTSIGYDAFRSCNGLTSVTIPDTVLELTERAFYFCLNLENVIIGNGVTSIGDSAFENCINLSACTIGSALTTVGSSAFKNCYNLTSIDLPNSLKTINQNAFSGCTHLASVTIGNGVTNIKYNAFRDCIRLSSVTINRETPPTLQTDVFGNTNNCPIYVPSGSVDTYKAASGWSTYASRIQAIT